MVEREQAGTLGTTTRRSFVKSAAAVGVLAAQGARAADAPPVKVGLVGMGGRGRMIAGMFRDHGGYDLVSCADYFRDSAVGGGAGVGIPEAKCFDGLSGYKRVIDSGIDAIVLETPPYAFPEHVRAAVDAGLHIYMAKPVACDVPGCLEVEQAAKEATAKGRVFLIDFQTRTDPFHIEGIRRVHAGEIGPIGTLFSTYTDEGFDDPPHTANIESRFQNLVWVNDIALGGGFLVNAGIHAVDVGLWLAGKRPVRAMGAADTGRGNPHGDSRDVYSLTYEFEDGLFMNHRGEHLKNRYGFRSECYAQCRDGYLETGYTTQVQMLGNAAGYAGGAVEGLYQRGAIANIASFHAAVVGEDYSNPTVAPSVDAALATILGREAGIRRTVLTWDELIKENKRYEVNLKGLKA